MKFTITGKKLEVSGGTPLSPPRKRSAIERLFRSVDSEAFITFSRERGRYTAEVTPQKQRYVLPGERDDRGYVRVH